MKSSNFLMFYFSCRKSRILKNVRIYENACSNTRIIFNFNRLSFCKSSDYRGGKKRRHEKGNSRPCNSSRRLRKIGQELSCDLSFARLWRQLSNMVPHKAEFARTCHFKPGDFRFARWSYELVLGQPRKSKFKV